MEHIFHYTNLDTGIKILETKSLRAGKFKNSNDPMENISISFYSDKLDDITQSDVNKKLNKKLKDDIHFLSFSEGEFFISDDLDLYSRFLLEDNRPGYFYPRMWGQYGEKHKGLCFVFNKNAMIESVAKYLDNYNIKAENVKYIDITEQEYFSTVYNSFRVDYEDLQKHKVDGYIEFMLEDNYKNLFFKKDIDWKLEKEFRFLIYPKKKRTSEKELSIPIADSLEGIFLGSSCQTDHRILNSLLDQIGINSYTINFGEGIIFIEKHIGS
ncbi:DUF2971 domain-containing protein [Leptospira noguchii]|uniref:DUF2971 domain-containing protein n=1 Tax=Leptospira noguchii TaxID=28182 RepID=UPI0007731032|nr:DUF2971 domain-containing protein [Leptospira noguchii]